MTGGPGSSVVLDGLMLEGDVVVAAGDLGSLTVAQSTVTGAIRAEADAGGANASLQVRVIRSVVGAVELAATVPMVVASDSVLDTVTVAPPPAGDLVLAGAGAHASLEGSTVRGDVAVRTLDASSCVLDGSVTVEHRQVGCVRFSYVAPGSRTPRRHRCVPADRAATTPTPVYVAADPGLAGVPRARRLVLAADRRRAARTSPRWASIITFGGRCACVRRNGSSIRTSRSGRSSGSSEADMHGDFSRWTFDRAAGYRAVLLQQGRVLLDADFNEQTAITTLPRRDPHARPRSAARAGPRTAPASRSSTAAAPLPPAPRGRTCA